MYYNLPVSCNYLSREKGVVTGFPPFYPTTNPQLPTRYRGSLCITCAMLITCTAVGIKAHVGTHTPVCMFDLRRGVCLAPAGAVCHVLEICLGQTWINMPTMITQHCCPSLIKHNIHFQGHRAKEVNPLFFSSVEDHCLVNISPIPQVCFLGMGERGELL